VRTVRKKKLTLEATPPSQIETEACMNPWNGECRNGDIAVYIFYMGRRIPICRKCWKEISSTDVEWSYD